MPALRAPKLLCPGVQASASVQNLGLASDLNVQDQIPQWSPMFMGIQSSYSPIHPCCCQCHQVTPCTPDSHQPIQPGGWEERGSLTATTSFPSSKAREAR